MREYFEQNGIYFNEFGYCQISIADLTALLLNNNLPLEEIFKNFYEAGLKDANFDASNEVKFRNRLDNFYQFRKI